MYKQFYIDVMSHGVRLHGLSSTQLEVLAPYLSKLKLKEQTQVRDDKTHQLKNVTVIKKHFFVLSEVGRELFIHRHMLDDLLNALDAAGLSTYTRRDIPAPVALTTHYVVRNHFIPRDYQNVVINMLNGPSHTTGVKLQVGKGKTLCALYSCANRAQRVIVMIAPAHFVIWEKAFKEVYEDGTYNYRTVSGSKQLKELLHEAENGGVKEDIILMSNITYRGYIEALERYGSVGMKELGYTIPPYEFHAKLGLGVQINDEVHFDIGLAFRIDCVTNIVKQFYLTATPYSGTDELTRMIDLMLPPTLDAPVPTDDPYTGIVNVEYDNTHVMSYHYSGYKGAYSHVNYEGSIRKSRKSQNEYFRKITRVLTATYIDKKEKGQKALIFFATTKMIAAYVKYLKQLPEYKELVVSQYVSGTDRSVLVDSDIIVSTLKSCGTGVDIIDLSVCLNTVATNSKKDVIQACGRLRRMKNWPEWVPIYVLFTCRQIAKQFQYSENNRRYLQDRAVYYRVLAVR